MNLVVVITISLICGAGLIFAKRPPTISFYYESDCPDCKSYVQEHLYPVWKSFKNDVIIDLVPFGKAMHWKEDGHLKFKCQHGPQECLDNKLHACAIHQACGPSGSLNCTVDKLSLVMDYLLCISEKYDQEKATHTCVSHAGLEADSIVQCAHGPEGDRLLSHYGDRTAGVHPRVGWQTGNVPTVTINGKYNRLAEENLMGVINEIRSA